MVVRVRDDQGRSTDLPHGGEEADACQPAPVSTSMRAASRPPGRREADGSEASAKTCILACSSAAGGYYHGGLARN